jgi:hypothetical protein
VRELTFRKPFKLPSIDSFFSNNQLADTASADKDEKYEERLITAEI